jgi:uncharacterized protein (TIGR03435 family)
MMIRLLTLLLVVIVGGAFGQVGLFGPISVRLKASDLAPDPTFSKILNAPGGARWFSGQMTVLAFFPDTSHNPQAIERWNALVEQFADKPVQFVWITSEEETSLVPFLEGHPIKSWVLLDQNGATGRAYGMEVPEGVIVGADQRIIGFDKSTVPMAETLTAAIEGRVTTTPPDRAAFMAFMKSGRALMDAEPFRMPSAEDHRPNFPPSNTLHVTSSTGDNRGNYGGMDSWSLQGFDVKEFIAEVYGINLIRIHLPIGLDERQRYDFSLVLPQAESKESIYDRFRQGIQDHFHVTALSEDRLEDVYVVTSTDRKPPARKAAQDDNSIAFNYSSSVEYQVLSVADGDDQFPEPPKSVGLDAIRGVSVDGTLDQFCHTLEGQLDRPVVNETHLDGQFELHVEGGQGLENNFLERLRTDLGLVITATQRNVKTLVFEPRN